MDKPLYTFHYHVVGDREHCIRIDPDGRVDIIRNLPIGFVTSHMIPLINIGNTYAINCRQEFLDHWLEEWRKYSRVEYDQTVSRLKDSFPDWVAPEYEDWMVGKNSQATPSDEWQRKYCDPRNSYSWETRETIIA